jgi:manganese/zinc/iron transport system permease protein
LMLAVHLLNHEHTPEADDENRVAHLGDHLHWPAARVAEVMRRAERRGLVTQQGATLVLTPHGRQLAEHMIGASG